MLTATFDEDRFFLNIAEQYSYRDILYLANMAFAFLASSPAATRWDFYFAQQCVASIDIVKGNLTL